MKTIKEIIIAVLQIKAGENETKLSYKLAEKT